MKKRFGNLCNLWFWVPLFCCLLTVASASAWWNEAWQYRKKISFNTTDSGAAVTANLTDVPLLVRLHTGNFAFGNAQQEGQDLRFVASDDTTLLKHHIERYDVIDELGFVWVKVPRLSARTDQEFIWLYYGNKDAMGGQDAKNTFDAAQAAVFHLGEIEGTPQDASLYGQAVVSFSGGQSLPSVIGNGVSFNGVDDRLVIKASPSLSFDQGLTFSAWVRVSQPQRDAWLLHLPAETGEMVVGIDGTKIYSRVTLADDVQVETDRSADLAAGQWHHVMVTAAPKQRLTLYVDGLEMFFAALPAGLPVFDRDIAVGAAGDGGHALLGDLDEVRLATTVRSDDWARAAYAGQGPEGALYSVGVEEMGEGGGMPVFFLGTILRNITLDGWLVIGSLIVLMIISWVVFLGKTFTLWVTGRENTQFISSFNTLEDPVAAFDAENGYENSNLYRVYAEGCRTVQANGHKQTDGLMKHVKAALEKAYIEESKQLNAWVMMLTMAISGGPFLGLLGTVWGVMNTFAAMAAAGEANIMAIAPGVASALSTTVFGLIVAIPALFAYNYLTSRIKSITADLAVFIDQFVLKVENSSGGTR